MQEFFKNLGNRLGSGSGSTSLADATAPGGARPRNETVTQPSAVSSEVASGTSQKKPKVNQSIPISINGSDRKASQQVSFRSSHPARAATPQTAQRVTTSNSTSPGRGLEGRRK